MPSLGLGRTRVKTTLSHILLRLNWNGFISFAEPELLRKLVKFACSSSSWLVYLAIFADSSYDVTTDFKQLDNPAMVRKPTDPLNLIILAKIPEFFITNVVEFLIFLHRFKDSNVMDLFIGDTFKY